VTWEYVYFFEKLASNRGAVVYLLLWLLCNCIDKW